MRKAAELKAFYRIVGGDISALPVLHLATNHTIANIGNTWNTRTTPGGGGPKFHSSVRIDLRYASKIRNDKEVVGVLCRVVIEKNRLCPPWKEVRLAIPFYEPISRASGLIPVLLNLGILTMVGNFLHYEGKKTGLHAYKDKDKVLQQDEEGERLLDQIPEILEAADTWLADQAPSIGTGTPQPDEETDEGT